MRMSSVRITDYDIKIKKGGNPLPRSRILGRIVDPSIFRTYNRFRRAKSEYEEDRYKNQVQTSIIGAWNEIRVWSHMLMFLIVRSNPEISVQDLYSQLLLHESLEDRYLGHTFSREVGEQWWDRRFLELKRMKMLDDWNKLQERVEKIYSENLEKKKSLGSRFKDWLLK